MIKEKVKNHTISISAKINTALQKLDGLGQDAIIFVVDKQGKLQGSLTDGDIRRGLIRGLTLNNQLIEFIQKTPKFLILGSFDIEKMKLWRNSNFKIIPIVDDSNVIVDIINFRILKAFLPIDAVIMAGGEGRRLRPLTDNLPKPLLKIGNKPIIEYNIRHLKSFGINQQYISVNYLGNKIKQYFEDGKSIGVNIKYLDEKSPLGTIGAVKQLSEIDKEFILVMNSDILTNINFEEMFVQMTKHDADMIVATIPYEVKIPYGVIETRDKFISGLKEKPTYTYYSNAGIYIVKKHVLNLIPKNINFNATDLIESLIAEHKKVVHFPILGYWLDIGKPQDFEKAQNDIQHINFS